MNKETYSLTITGRQNILLLYPYYWPHYKAGGPVQSLFNLVSYFSNVADFFIVSLDRDIDGQPPDKIIQLNTWSTGPNAENIFFTSYISPFLLLKLIKEINPDAILINGIFNINTTLPGLLWGKLLRKKIVISPRGMLQFWALQRNKAVKKVFLSLLQVILRKDEHWHATDDQEKADIIKIFGIGQQVNVASNIPRKLSKATMVPLPDGEGKIKLVFLSLINPNKNLHMVIDQVNKMKTIFSLDIYGPVIDEKYWIFCNNKIKDSTISYKGPVPSWSVPEIISQYHFFILPTEGENFGHAIFDALASGVPVIISKNTPWNNIDTNHAGFYIENLNEEGIFAIFQKVAAMTPEYYTEFRNASLQFARKYLENKDYNKDYGFLFDTQTITNHCEV